MLVTALQTHPRWNRREGAEYTMKKDDRIDSIHSTHKGRLSRVQRRKGLQIRVRLQTSTALLLSLYNIIPPMALKVA